MADASIDAAALRAEGWECLALSDFSNAAGPYWTRGQGDTREVGIIAEERHRNTHAGMVHGGALMTLADVSLGLGVADVLGHVRCVTAELKVNFVAAGQVGAFITCRPELIRRTRHLIFMRGLLMADGKVVSSADGIWKELEPR